MPFVKYLNLPIIISTILWREPKNSTFFFRGILYKLNIFLNVAVDNG